MLSSFREDMKARHGELSRSRYYSLVFNHNTQANGADVKGPDACHDSLEDTESTKTRVRAKK